MDRYKVIALSIAIISAISINTYTRMKDGDSIDTTIGSEVRQCNPTIERVISYPSYINQKITDFLRTGSINLAQVEIIGEQFYQIDKFYLCTERCKYKVRYGCDLYCIDYTLDQRCKK